jgi:hypothetical protein
MSKPLQVCEVITRQIHKTNLWLVHVKTHVSASKLLNRFRRNLIFYTYTKTCTNFSLFSIGPIQSLSYRNPESGVIDFVIKADLKKIIHDLYRGLFKVDDFYLNYFFVPSFSKVTLIVIHVYIQ